MRITAQPGTDGAGEEPRSAAPAPGVPLITKERVGEWLASVRSWPAALGYQADILQVHRCWAWLATAHYAGSDWPGNTPTLALQRTQQVVSQMRTNA